MISRLHPRLFILFTFTAFLSLNGCGETTSIEASAGQTREEIAAPDLPEGATPGLPEIAADAPDRFPVEVDGQWGYIDREGSLVIEPQFDDAQDFHEGLAAVEVDGMFGYIDRDGQMVIEPSFEAAGIFSEGLAAVMPSEDDGTIGFIDTSGELVVDPEYQPAFYFPGNPEVSRFGDGRAPVRPLKGGLIGFIDSDGEWAIEPTYDFAGLFAEGKAPVEGPAGTWMYINPDGETVLEGDWTGALPFSDGLAAVSATKGGSTDWWHYIDEAGEVAAHPTFGSGDTQPERAQSFSEGLAPIYYDGPNRWEYILPDGERADFVTVEPHRWFDEASPFRGGLARVELLKRRQNQGGTGEMIYIHRNGTIVWPSPTGERSADAPAVTNQ